nr:DUF2203 family protein [Thermus parvatiensis]
MFARIFTKEEADALLPEIQRVLSQMRQARAELKEAQARLPEARGLSGGPWRRRSASSWAPSRPTPATSPPWASSSRIWTRAWWTSPAG